MTSDENFMRRAFELANTGLGDTAPNPCVGCVIVSHGKIIGEGWHMKYGGPHAEVNAINSVKDKLQLKSATVYVNLEPCSHFGKTPPCADLLVSYEVKRVVISNMDTNPLVGGKGVRKLIDAGIEVTQGVLESEGRELNRRFFTFIEKQRPYIILKWAQTADRFIARLDYDSKWISNVYSRQLVHKWRSEEASVLVGRNTAEKDDPQLSVREWSGKNPVRVVIDRNLKLLPTLKLFDGSQPTICYNLVSATEKNNLLFVKVREEHLVADVLKDLYYRQIQSVLVEGGREISDLFIAHQVWDEARIFTSVSSFGKGIKAPEISGALVSKIMVQGDSLEIFRPLKN
jgi:diaminohydroxyphosphoribosylaminopyrimidine deaminase / 5-amino-6-(5-phosphoribosylamino)uracil reductase